MPNSKDLSTTSNPIDKLSSQYFLTIMDWEVLREWEKQDKERYQRKLQGERINVISIIKQLIIKRSMNLNKIFLLGRATQDVELKVSTNGQSVATVNMATNRFYKDAQGNKKEDVQFHRIVIWGKQAETTATFVKKGDIFLVEGRVATRQWEDKQGNKRSITEIVAENIQFAPRKVEKASEPDEEIPVIEDGEDIDINPDLIPF